MPTRQHPTPQSPAASAKNTAPSPTAPTTASEAAKVTTQDEVTRIEVAPLPINEPSYEGLPEKTVREMKAGRMAVRKHADYETHVSTIMTQSAEEMFSKQAKIWLTDKRVALQEGTNWSAHASLDPGKHEWTVTIKVTRPGVPPAELSEPFPQFPSDEMIAWLMMVG